MGKLSHTSTLRQSPIEEFIHLQHKQPFMLNKPSRPNVAQHAFLYLQWLKVGVAVLGQQCPEDKSYNKIIQLFGERWAESSCQPQRLELLQKQQLKHSHQQEQKLQQDNRRLSVLQHTQADREVNGGDCCHSSKYSTTPARTDLGCWTQNLPTSQNYKDHKTGISEARRKYKQFENLKKLYELSKRHRQWKKPHKTHNYYNDNVEYDRSGWIRRLQNKDRLVSGHGVVTQNEVDKVSKPSTSQVVASARHSHTLPDKIHVATEDIGASRRSNIKTVEIYSNHSRRTNVKSSTHFKRVHDIYLENINNNQKCLSSPYLTLASCKNYGDYKIGSSFHYDILDPMWSHQKCTDSGSMSPKIVESIVKDSSMSSACPQQLDNNFQKHAYPCSPYVKKELLTDSDNSPLQAVLKMNIFSSPAKSIPIISDVSKSPIYETKHCNCGPTAPLSPWNTWSLLPRSPSFFSATAAVLSGKALVNENTEGVFMSP
ncbi:uncharacterized protein [Procambarus clarkii]|uniref:uncharacterized protein isoform X1 n=2 Tax=Procambarus clarkii TaxID=6728 RepID=UPI003743A1F1